jgi:PAS domain S-box-containing protein
MEEIFNFLINNFPGLAVILDDKYRIRKGNRHAYNLYTKIKGEVADPHQLRNQNLSYFHPRDKMIAALKTLDKGEPNHGYLEYKWDGVKRNVLYCHLPAKLSDGSQGVVILNLDFLNPIRKLKDLLEAFHQNYDLYFSQLGIGLFDTEGKILYVNKTILDISGLESEDLLGKNLFKDYKSYISKRDGNSILGEFILKGEFLHTKLYISKESIISNGCQSIVMEVISFPIEIEGQFLGSICIAMNLNQLTKYSNQVKQFERLENIREMAFRVIHEIRNPLQEIMAVAELGKIKSKQEEIESYFEHIKAGIGWVNDLLNDIIQISDPSSLDLEEVKLDHICQEILADISKDHKDIYWKSSIADIEVVLDRELFKEIIFHLVDNALDALANKTGEKKIIISTSVQREDIIFSIYNSGHKIPDKIRNSIFDPFTSTKGHNGTGLGLTVVYYIITKVFQGDIWFESDNNGTTFFFKIKKDIEEVIISAINNTDYKGIR